MAITDLSPVLLEIQTAMLSYCKWFESISCKAASLLNVPTGYRGDGLYTKNVSRLWRYRLEA